MLIHLESHFTDEKAGPLRGATYRRLRRHWQFINELLLFEIEDHKRYGISVYGSPREPDFLQAASLYHPATVERSLKHDGSGVEPGIKDPDGNWDLRPHASRIVHVTTDTLASWHAVLETDVVPIYQTRMVYAVNKSTATVLEKLAAAPRLAALPLRFSPGWHEKNDRTKGRFDSDWGVPESWDEVILQGPHIHVATPFFKTPNPTMLNNQDWTATDFETLRTDAIPSTSWKPRGNATAYDAAYTQWKTEPEGSATPARHYYRLAWRNMAANTGERTLIPALIPPGTAHIHGVSAAGLPGDDQTLVLVAGFAATLVHDFAVRSAPKSTISAATVNRLPFVNDPALQSMILLRTLRLNCVTSAYAKLWESCYSDAFARDTWTASGLDRREQPLGAVAVGWDASVPLRRAVSRRRALLEIDVLVALALGIEIDELCTIYRTQFPVLYGYDQHSQLYDRDGRLAPSAVIGDWRRQGAPSQPKQPLVAVHPGSSVEYEFSLPLTTLDREADMRLAHEEFQARIAKRRSNSS